MKLDLKRIKEQNLSLEFLAKKMVEGFITGLHKSPYHGFSVEFAEHRLYNTGESTKYIDWKVFAKTDRLYTKTFEEETNLRCHILLDCSSSMHYPLPTKEKINYAIHSAAALSWLLHKQRDAVGITSFADKIFEQTEVKSKQSHVHKLFTTLENVLKYENKLKTTNLPDVINHIAQTIHKRSLVVIFSDMLTSQQNTEGIFSALQHLKHRKHEIIIYHITDNKTELHFDFDDRPHLFVDLETGREIKLQPAEFRAEYKKKAQSQLHELKRKCGQLQINFVQADISDDFNHILNTYLIKRSKMN